MTARPDLTALQAKELAAARQLLKAGNATGAVGRIRPLLATGLVHADAYALFGAALHKAAMFDEARRSLNAAINLDPGNTAFWSMLADLLEDTGELAAQITARQRIASLLPGNGPAQIKLGELLIRSGDGDGAVIALQTATSLDPQSTRAAHNYAIALRMVDRPQDAAAALKPFVGQHDADAATVTLYGHVLADLGQHDDAAATYRSALILNPLYLDAHDTLARLLPQLGKGKEALETYRKSLFVHPGNEALWAAALGAARSLGHTTALLEWAEQAMARFPLRRDFTIAYADALGTSGAIEKALALLEPLASHPANDPLAATQAAHWKLAAGDAAAASHYAQQVTAIQPHNQAAWAYLGTSWRLSDDQREPWLNDYDSITTAFLLEPPPGYTSTAEFLIELAEFLTTLHTTMQHPAEQSLRHGTQTRGHLFLRRHPIVEALGLTLHRQITGWLASLPQDTTHPFLGRNSGQMAFKNSWSVRLRDSGFHISHIHQDGWLSSAFYVALPKEMSEQGAVGNLPVGALTLGVPDLSLGLDLAPQRVVVPEPGMLALFPSYVWHATVPFSSDDPRLTVAFDGLPA